MQLTTSYPKISLDSIANASTFFSGRWTPELKRNQSPYLLTHIINKLYGASHGSMFKARVRASQASIAASLDLSREWTCKLIARLRVTGWITTEAPRLPNGKQEVTTFRPGKMLKRLLVMLLRSKQRPQNNRVNTSSQKIPTKEERERSKALFGSLIEEVAKKLGRKT